MSKSSVFLARRRSVALTSQSPDMSIIRQIAKLQKRQEAQKMEVEKAEVLSTPSTDSPVCSKAQQGNLHFSALFFILSDVLPSVKIF